MKRAITTWGESGGSGKTTLAVNTAAALAQDGSDVLAIDLDPQPGCLSDHVGVERDVAEYHVGDVMAEPDTRDIWSLVQQAGSFDVIPSHEGIANTEAALTANPDIRIEEYQLQAALEMQGVYDQYDYIVIDPQASLDILVDNALVAARNVVAPVELSSKGKGAIRGLRSTVETMERGLCRVEDDFSINILAVVPNQYEGTNIETQTRQRLVEDGEPVTDVALRQRNILQYAWDARQTVYDYIDSHDDSVREYERDVLDVFDSLARIVRTGQRPTDGVETDQHERVTA